MEEEMESQKQGPVVATTGPKTVAKPTMPRWEAQSRERLKAAMRKYTRALADLRARDANEADTRLFVTDFLTDGLGFDKYSELNTEYRVKGEYVDYGIRLDNDIVAFVEVKRINTKLGQKHLRQAQAYAVNEGVEWIILTNGAEWQVYHLSGGLPIVTSLAMEVDLTGDAPHGQKADLLFNLTREGLKRGRLTELWQAKRATSPGSISQVLLSEPVLTTVRRELKKATGYNVDTAEILRLVRETCLRPECFEK